MGKSNYTIANRSVGEWLSTLPVLILLLLTIFLGSGEIIHSQLLRVGQHLWNDYFLLRGDIPEPACNPNPDIDKQVQQAVAKAQQQNADDPLASLLGESVNPDDIRKSLEGSRDICRDKWARYKETKSRVTTGVRVYRTIETGVAYLVSALGDFKRLLLCLLLLVCAGTTTLKRHHIALRPARTIKDHYLATGAQFVANALLTFSSVAYRQQELASMHEGVQVSYFFMHKFWIIGFGLMTLFSLYQLIKPPRDQLETGGSWLMAPLSIPLYSYMCLTAGSWFLLSHYYAGISVYLGQMMELSSMFLNLALYIWIGMMLKQTRLAHLVFDVFRPWNMSAELLCFVVIVVAAVPTAYTGASGIFVIAAGAVIYNELLRAGARRQLALASTAMSGSLGVVLNPCLLVVIIAALNKSVTTTELFASGQKIFMFTTLLFFIVSQLARRDPVRIAPINQALPGSLRALIPIIPYAVIMLLVLGFYKYGLSRNLDEFSAPIILPVVMLAILFYEYVITKPSIEEDKELLIGDKGHTMEQAMRIATTETVGHCGALLMLMALSVSMGGIIERSGVMNMVPDHFSSIWVAMTLLVVVMVIIGMIMDPYGAVILVNATIAQVAYKAGIAPLHFWIISLTAFELGYLTPPVALNHLLTRQVVGEGEMDLARDEAIGMSFWRRHERYLLPIAVMATALLAVAYVPLMFHGLHSWLFQQIAVPQ